MSPKDKPKATIAEARKSKLEIHAEELVDKVMDGEISLNEAIKDLDKRLEVFDKVKVHRDRLLAARRALMGTGNILTGSGGSRTTVNEVHQWLEVNGPATYAEMATGLSTNEAVIRGHMSRGKDERFARNGDGKWHVIDHEAESDEEIEEEGDEE